MNLSDTGKLTIQDLEVLSRLLMLLAIYCKAEIGLKLLDHFKTIADPQMLSTAARGPLSENDSINKLVNLANIFLRVKTRWYSRRNGTSTDPDYMCM